MSVAGQVDPPIDQENFSQQTKRILKQELPKHKALTEELNAQRAVEKEVAKGSHPDAALQKLTTVQICKTSVFGSFGRGLKKISNAWGRKMMMVPDVLLSGALTIVSSTLLLNAITQLTAIKAAAQAGASIPQGPGTPTTGAKLPTEQLQQVGVTLKQATTIGFVANALTIAYSLTATVFGVVDICSKFKKGVKLSKKLHAQEKVIKQTKKDLHAFKEGGIEKQGVIDRLKQDNPSIEASEVEQHLVITQDRAEAKIAKYKKARIGLGLGGFIKALSVTTSILKTIEASMQIASVALIFTQGAITATAQTLTQLAGVLGPVGAGIGVALGGLATGLYGFATFQAHRKVRALQAEITKYSIMAESTNPEDKAIGKLCLKRAEVQLAQARDDRRNSLLSFSSNSVLTVAAVAGLCVAAGAFTGPAALIVAGSALGVMLVAGGLSAYHLYSKKKTDKVLRDKKLSLQKEADLQESIAGIDLKNLNDAQLQLLFPEMKKIKDDAARDKFVAKVKKSPEHFLSTRFVELDPSQIDKADLKQLFPELKKMDKADAKEYINGLRADPGRIMKAYTDHQDKTNPSKGD
jgi:hypothetical protein